MPHFIVEYTDNLENTLDFQDLFKTVNDFLGNSGVFPLGGIRSRAICLDKYRVADGQHDYAFIHMSLKVGSGRDLDTRQKVATELFALIEQFFQPLKHQRLLAISFEMTELDPVLNFKSNNIHQFLKKQA